MTTFDRYDHLPEPIKQALAELEDFIGDLDGKTMGTEASDGEGFIDEGTVDADDAVKAFNVIVAALPAQEWQDISTAPKDGTKVLVCHKTRRGVVGIETASWGKDNWLNVLNLCIENPHMRFAEILARTITHWQPLPAPPIAIIAEGRTDG